jgi:hypothetical protein
MTASVAVRTELEVRALRHGLWLALLQAQRLQLTDIQERLMILLVEVDVLFDQTEDVR